MGFEAINATASVYMPLLFLALVAVCLPPRGRFPVWAYAVGALIVALTIPSSAVLLIVLLVQALRSRIRWRSVLIVGLAAVVGLVLQWHAMVTAGVARPLNWSVAAVGAWAASLPVAGATLLPGQVEISPTGAFALAHGELPGWIGWVVAGALLAVSVALASQRDVAASGLGLLVAGGLVLGLLPAAAGYANNRYFVVPVLAITAAVVIGLDRWSGRGHEAVVGVLAIAVIAVSFVGLSASPTRSTAVPRWGEMLAHARATCAADPAATVALTFTPSWPFADARFPGPTNNVVTCALLQGDGA
jgi:hypothetical protein